MSQTDDASRVRSLAYAIGTLCGAAMDIANSADPTTMTLAESLRTYATSAVVSLTAHQDGVPLWKNAKMTLPVTTFAVVSKWSVEPYPAYVDSLRILGAALLYGGAKTLGESVEDGQMYWLLPTVATSLGVQAFLSAGLKDTEKRALDALAMDAKASAEDLWATLTGTGTRRED